MPTSNPKTEGPFGKDHSTAFGMDLPLAIGRTAMQAWLDIGSDGVRFVSDRLQQDIKTQQAMLACSNLDEMRQVHAEFYKATQDQYATQARRMMEMTGKAATLALTLAPASKALGYDDVPV